MTTITATSLRQSLFKTLNQVLNSVPILIKYKGTGIIMMPVEQYQKSKMKRKAQKKLMPLVKGKINGTLDEKSDAEVMRYMGL